MSLDNNRIKILINEKLEFIRTNSEENYFTSLFSDYLKFLGNINTNNMEEAIRISQIFKKQIFH